MDNLRGAILMVLAMLFFAIEDMFIKLMADGLPTWQILGLLGLGGALVLVPVNLWRGEPLWSRSFLAAPVLFRSLGELVGTMGFITAITLASISSASAILQATPLAVTLGAAVFLGEPVGWRRWSAIVIGFVGVMLIVRPGMEGFNALSLFAVVAVFGLGLRDLATRRIARTISSFQLSFLAFLTLIPAAALLSLPSAQAWVMPTPRLWALLVVTILFGVLGYYAIVGAMRVGDVSYVTPFRYSRLLFALVVGIAVFGENPDLWTLLGAAIIVASGIYMVWRERKLRISV